jgi:hypothetical protein
MYTHHVLLIHSSAGRNFGCFHLLLVVTNAMNTVMQISLQDLAFNSFGYPEVEFLDHTVILVFHFLRNCLTVFEVAALVHIIQQTA